MLKGAVASSHMLLFIFGAHSAPCKRSVTGLCCEACPLLSCAGIYRAFATKYRVLAGKYLWTATKYRWAADPYRMLAIAYR